MVAHDNFTGKDTSPVNFKMVDGRPVPDEPHIRTRSDFTERDASVQTGYVRGGTTRPAQGRSGDIEQLDNDGNVSKVSPGEIARTVKEEGPQAGLKKLGGGLPPGDPEPNSKKATNKKGS